MSHDSLRERGCFVAAVCREALIANRAHTARTLNGGPRHCVREKGERAYPGPRRGVVGENVRCRHEVEGDTGRGVIVGWRMVAHVPKPSPALTASRGVTGGGLPSGSHAPRRPSFTCTPSNENFEKSGKNVVKLKDCMVERWRCAMKRGGGHANAQASCCLSALEHKKSEMCCAHHAPLLSLSKHPPPSPASNIAVRTRPHIHIVTRRDGLHRPTEA
jgi:hypothetical protein